MKKIRTEYLAVIQTALKFPDEVWNLEERSWTPCVFSAILRHTFGDESFQGHFAVEKMEVRIGPWGSGRADTPTCISRAWAFVLSPPNITQPRSWCAKPPSRWGRQQRCPVHSGSQGVLPSGWAFPLPEAPLGQHGSSPLGDPLSPLLCDRASGRRHSQPLPIKGNPEKTSSGIYCAFSLS